MPIVLSNRYKAVLMVVGACMKGGAAFCLLTIALIFGSIIHVHSKVGLFGMGVLFVTSTHQLACAGQEEMLNVIYFFGLFSRKNEI